MRAHVEGTVQGVGFRPWVYRIARENGLVGWVRNDTRGVVLEVEGPRARIGEFLRRLTSEAPLAAAVEPAAWGAVARMALSGLASPITTSMGRLFDAVAALCGIRSSWPWWPWPSSAPAWIA